MLISLIDSENYSVRNGMIEALGNLIIWTSKRETTSANQIEKYLDELEVRFKDSNSFVRTKVLHVCSTLVE